MSGGGAIDDGEIPGRFTEGELVATRVLRTRVNCWHAITWRHRGLSALYRRGWCGAARAVEINSGRDKSLPADSWYPVDLGEKDVSKELLNKHDRGAWVCKSCLAKARAILGEAP